MTDREHNPEKTSRSLLGDQLDAALANYAAVEPRAGLEERILATLRAEQSRSAGPGWRPWVAVAIVLTLAGLVIWRLENPRNDRVVRHPPNQQQEVQVGTDAPASAAQQDPPPPVRRPRGHASPAPVVVVVAEPKLDQFPSPQPLSNEEHLLVQYVTQFPQEATLIARAQEEYEKDLQKKMRAADPETSRSDSNQQER